MRAIVGGLVRLLLKLYFRRIERFHAERVPAEGPVLFVSNHPGSVTDAFIVGTSVPRQVHFIDALPVNTVGKIDRRRLEQEAQKRRVAA